MIFTFALWFHLVAAVIWVGGMLFLVTVLKPAVMGSQEKSSNNLHERAELLNYIHKRFRTIVGVMVGVLVATGLINLSRYTALFYSGIVSTVTIILGIKIVLALMLFTIYIVNVLSSKKAQAQHCIDKPTPQKMKFQMAAIIIAIAILFCSAWLRG